MILSRRTLMAGAATLAASAVLPASAAPQVDPRTLARAAALSEHRAACAAIFGPPTPDRVFDQHVARYRKAVASMQGLFSHEENMAYLMFDQAPADVAAVDPSWTPPRSHG